MHNHFNINNMKIETINKVYTLLKDIKLRCDKNIVFNPDKLSKEMKVSDNIFRTARKLGFFKKEGNKFICNVPEITREIAIECIETFNNSIKLSYNKNKSTSTPGKIEIEIKPVRIKKPRPLPDKTETKPMFDNCKILETIPIKTEEPEMVPVKKIGDKQHDPVNYPDHYTKDYTYESIEMMIRVYGKDKVILFLELSAFQYRMRMGKKQGVPLEIDFAKEQQCLKMMNEFKNN